MRTRDARRRERTCELCGQHFPGDTVRVREIPIGDFMVKRRVCPTCATAANKVSHEVGSQDTPEAVVRRMSQHKQAEKQTAQARMERRREQYRASDARKKQRALQSKEEER